ncbi:MAG: hypothetical protein WCP15_00310, partial [bacterium]
MENLEEYRSSVFDQDIPENYQDFSSVLKIWFSSGRLYQFLVYRKISNRLIGTVYFYHHNEE